MTVIQGTRNEVMSTGKEVGCALRRLPILKSMESSFMDGRVSRRIMGLLQTTKDKHSYSLLSPNLGLRMLIQTETPTQVRLPLPLSS